MKIIVFGHRRHGKDTACDYIQDNFGLMFESSSYYACRTFLFQKLRKAHGYKTVEECFEDRVHHRELWFNEIRDYNSNDRTRLGREIFESNQVYCGIRDIEEFDALKAAGLFDLAIWIDARERLPLETAASMKLTKNDADIIIENNGKIEEFHEKIDRLFKLLSVE